MKHSGTRRPHDRNFVLRGVSLHLPKHGIPRRQQRIDVALHLRLKNSWHFASLVVCPRTLTSVPSTQLFTTQREVRHSDPAKPESNPLLLRRRSRFLAARNARSRFRRRVSLA